MLGEHLRKRSTNKEPVGKLSSPVGELVRRHDIDYKTEPESFVGLDDPTGKGKFFGAL